MLKFKLIEVRDSREKLENEVNAWLARNTNIEIISHSFSHATWDGAANVHSEYTATFVYKTPAK